MDVTEYVVGVYFIVRRPASTVIVYSYDDIIFFFRYSQGLFYLGQMTHRAPIGALSAASNLCPQRRTAFQTGCARNNK